MHTIQDILNNKAKITNIIPPSAKVIDALRLLNEVNLSYLVVMYEKAYKGIFSERDYSRNVILKGRSSDSTIVEEVMTTDLPALSISDTVEYAMNTMNNYKTRYLLVFDENVLKGVITIHDLLRAVLATKETIIDRNLTNALIDNDEGGSRIY